MLGAKIKSARYGDITTQGPKDLSLSLIVQIETE